MLPDLGLGTRGWRERALTALGRRLRSRAGLALAARGTVGLLEVAGAGIVAGRWRRSGKGEADEECTAAGEAHQRVAEGETG